jgi:hypothetical protein
MTPDPARNRFFIIQAARLAGVAGVIAGMLIASQRTALPGWAGYPLLAAGLVGVFVIPTWLARRWRTPQ